MIYQQLFNGISKAILFADDSSNIFTSCNLRDLKNYIKIEFGFWNKWFSQNFEKPHFMQFITKNSPPIDLDISYTNTSISEVHDTKFLGIYTDSTLSWKYHVKRITHKLSAQLAMDWDQLSLLCHRKHWKWFTIPIFIPLWTMN